MGSKNGTWLRFMKAALDPLHKLAQSLQGEKGVDPHCQSSMTSSHRYIVPML